MHSYELFWLTSILACVYTLGLVFYRIYLHPLAKFPGPKLAAATGWYETYIDLFRWPQGNFMEDISKWHRKYGPIVRINPHEIHVCDSTWLDTLYTGPAYGKRDKYPPTAYMTGTPRGVFGTVSHELHRLRRGAINPLFSKSGAAAAVPMIYEHTEKLLARIQTQISRDGFAEMRANFLAFATDNVSLYSTGKSRALLDDEALATQWRKSIGNLAEWTLIARHFSWVIPFVLEMPMALIELVLPRFSRIVGLHRDMLELASDYVEAASGNNDAKDKSVESQNVFRMVLSSDQLPPSEKAANRMSHEGVVMIAAGGETTARGMTIALYNILSNKDTVLPKLLQELELVMPDPHSQPTLKELESLPWLSAIIKESLRIMALPTTRFPLVSPREALQYKDWVIPAGTPVSMTIRDVLIDPNIFEKPHEFHPERWLPTNPDLDKLNRYFVPFGRGNRMCIGVSLAYAEMYVCLASIFRRLELDLHDTIHERDILIVRDCFIGETSPNTKGVRVKYADGKADV
ncbi:putative cytochrome P450 [Xylaria palmicola]|nr:putative cytochrome P450 [Xylaria palmicola]